MRVVFDGELLHPPASSMDIAVKEINRYLQERLNDGRVLDRVIIDGTPVHENWETYLQGLVGCGDPVTVEVITVTAKHLAMESLKSARDYIYRLLLFMDESLGALRSGDMFAVNWTPFIDGLSWLLDVVQMAALPNFANKLVIPLQDLNTTLHEMNMAIGNADTVALSDLLEYELSGQLAETAECISGLLKDSESEVLKQ